MSQFKENSSKSKISYKSLAISFKIHMRILSDLFALVNEWIIFSLRSIVSPEFHNSLTSFFSSSLSFAGILRMNYWKFKVLISEQAEENWTDASPCGWLDCLISTSSLHFTQFSRNSLATNYDRKFNIFTLCFWHNIHYMLSTLLYIKWEGMNYFISYVHKIYVLEDMQQRQHYRRHSLSTK